MREEVKFNYRQLPKVMGNLLERYAGTHYQYDERGNHRRQTEPSGHTTEYLYDADDRLIEVKRYRRAPAAGDTTPPEMHAKYGYDGFGRRLWKLVKEGKAKSKLTVFSWDANLLTSEEVFEGEFHFWDIFAYPKEPELEPEDPSKTFSLPVAQRVHTLTARALKRTHWLYEPDSFVPAAQLVDTYDQRSPRMTGTGSVAYSSHESAGLVTTELQLYYIHTDHLGTPQELTDRDGNLQWVEQYRAWGELAKANDSEGHAANVEMSLRFQGQYCDAETGLHYNRFRYYDPQVGRFTTQDPIGLAGGISLYQYAPNPVQWADPLGLSPMLPCPHGNGSNSRPDFYVGPAGPSVTMPSTAYRHMNYQNSDGTLNKFVAPTLENKSAPVTYFGFEKYSSGSMARDKFQISPEWSDARMRGSFDTLQLYKNGEPTAFVPKWQGNTHPSQLEPFAEAYPEFGSGGAAQLHADGQLIKFDSIDILPD